MDNFQKKMGVLREKLEAVKERFKTAESELSSINNTLVEAFLLHSISLFLYQSI